MGSLQLSPKPNYKLIGHRGAAGLKPENTLIGFKYAAELGLNWVEYDVRLTKDKVWILMHDKTYERTTNINGVVSELNYKAIVDAQTGLWFEPPYHNEKIPTLLETYELCSTLGLNQNIEVKGTKGDPKGHAEALNEFLVKNVPSYFPQPLVSCFDLAFLKHLRKINPHIPIGYLIMDFADNTLDICKKHNFNSVNCLIDTMQEKYLAAANEASIPLTLYTVNDPKLAKLWLERGVSAIFTDRPDLMFAELGNPMFNTEKSTIL